MSQCKSASLSCAASALVEWLIVLSHTQLRAEPEAFLVSSDRRKRRPDANSKRNKRDEYPRDSPRRSQRQLYPNPVSPLQETSTQKRLQVNQEDIKKGSWSRSVRPRI